MWEQLGMIRGGRMPLSGVWRTLGLRFSTRSGAGSVHPPRRCHRNPTVSGTAIGPPVYLSSDAIVEPIYWINGLAGIGKSTIARMVAEDANHRKLLGASFFFSRQETELSDPHVFIPTIAYQLARSYPEARSVVINVFQHDPDIVRKAFAIQFKELVV